jgi:hypothetical protein
MNAPTPEQIQKLPKWAQDYIQNLAREREMSVRALNEFCDNDTPSPFYFEGMVCNGETQGPSSKRRYIQANSITVVWRGIELQVDAHDYGNRGSGIGLRWSTADRAMREAAFVPESYQSARIVAREDMR